MKILVSWVGNADLKASRGEGDGLGPVGQAVTVKNYNQIVLLCNYGEEKGKQYQEWLAQKTKSRMSVTDVSLSSPTEYKEIYEVVNELLLQIKKKYDTHPLTLTYHLSPGTPAMSSIWMLLGKTIHPAKFIESSIQLGVRDVHFPFDIAAEYIPELKSELQKELIALTQALPPQAPAFADIHHKCKVMKELIAKAQRLAIFDVPVLIQGESGTGKELFARAVHASSKRSNKPFIAVNCGAIPKELFESEFFGHERGAFTGADQRKAGHFESANGGTLFLDEIGELPLEGQVKLLRVLQEQCVQRLGGVRSISVDFRIIAATNRQLIEEVQESRFRVDLFHRLAIGMLNLPPLRERKGDLNLLIDRIMRSLNHELSKQQYSWKTKTLSAGARNLLHTHPWYGNVRELHNTLSRILIWSLGEEIRKEQVQEALFSVHPRETGKKELILNRKIGEDFDLHEVMAEVVQHYLKRAVEENKGNKSKAAQALNFKNYQNLNNWIQKYKVEL